jgi:hypothetical protein
MLNSEENFDNFGEDQEGGGMFGMFSKKSDEPSMPSLKDLPTAKLAEQKKWDERKNLAKKTLIAPVTGPVKILGQGAKVLASTPQAFSKMNKAIKDFGSTPLSPNQQIDLTKDLSQREYSDGIVSFNSKYNEFIKKIINPSDLEESKVKVEKRRILQLLCEIRSFDIKKKTTEVFNSLAIYIENVLNSRGGILDLGKISEFMNNNIDITKLIIDTINNNNDAIEKNATIRTNLKKFFLQLLIIYFYPSTILYIICENMIEYIDIIKTNRDKFIDESTDSQDIKNTLDSLLDIFNQNKNARLVARGRSRVGNARQENMRATAARAAAARAGPEAEARAARDEAERAAALVTGREVAMEAAARATEIDAERAANAAADPRRMVAKMAAARGAERVALWEEADGEVTRAREAAREAEAERAAREAPAARAEAAELNRAAAREEARRRQEYPANFQDGGAPLDHSNIDLTMIKNYNNLPEHTNPYLNTSARMFYKALTNFAVSITIYDKDKDEVKQTIVEYLQTIFMDKFLIIFDDNFTKSDVLKDAEKQFDDMRSKLESTSNGKNFIARLIELETLQAELKTINDTDDVEERTKVEVQIDANKNMIEKFKVNISVADDIARYIAAKKILDFRSQPLETIKKNNIILRDMFAPSSDKNNLNSNAYIDDYYKFITEIFDGETGDSSNYIITIDKSIVKGIGMSSMFAFSSYVASTTTLTTATSASPDALAPARAAAGRVRVAAAPALAAAPPPDLGDDDPGEDRPVDGGKRRTRRYKKHAGTRRYKKRAGTRRQKKRRGTHRKRKNTTK